MKSISVPRLGLVLLTSLAALPSAQAKGVYSAGQWTKETLDLFATIPVQEGGRVKPLDTFAAFKMLRINSKRTMELETLGTIHVSKSGAVAATGVWVLSSFGHGER